MPQRPTPTNKRKLEGNPSGRPMPANEPDYAGVAAPPAHLNDVGQVEWDRLIEMLRAVGLATQGEQAILGLYIDAYMRWDEAVTEVRKLGMVVKAPTGFPVQNPYLPIINKAHEQMIKYLIEMGLTPAAKTKVEQGVPPADDGTGLTPWQVLEGKRADRRARAAEQSS